MKKALIALFLFSCAELFAGGNPELRFSESLGTRPTHDQLREAATVFLSDSLYDVDYDYVDGTLFDYLAGKGLWDELLYAIGHIKTLSGSYPDYPRGYHIFNNPLCVVYSSDAISSDRKRELIRGIVELDERYINWPSYNGMGNGASPILEAIRYDDPEMVEYLIRSGDYLHYSVEVLPYTYVAMAWPKNTLSLARSTAVKDILVRHGVPKIHDFPTPVDGWCIADRVRLRKEPSLSGEIIGHLSKDEKIKAISSGYEREIISGAEGCWVYVDTGAQRGWAFSTYIYCPAILEP